MRVKIEAVLSVGGHESVELELAYAEYVMPGDSLLIFNREYLMAWIGLACSVMVVTT